MPVFECCCAAAEIRKFVTCMVTTLRPTLLLLLASLSSNMTENWAPRKFFAHQNFFDHRDIWTLLFVTRSYYPMTLTLAKHQFFSKKYNDYNGHLIGAKKAHAFFPGEFRLVSCFPVPALCINCCLCPDIADQAFTFQEYKHMIIPSAVWYTIYVR